jgi:hypothetical protein
MAGKFRGDTFKFPDEMPVRAKVGEDENEVKVEFEIEGQEPKAEEKKVEEKKVEVKVEEPNDSDIEIVEDEPVEPKAHDADPNEEELDNYSANVKKRIDKLTLARREEERAKQAALREKQEMERVAAAMAEENRRLQEMMQNGEKAYMEKVEALAKVELERAKSKMTQAYDAGDSAALANAQEEMMLASMKLQQAQNFRPTPLQQPKPVVHSAPTVPADVEPDLDPKTAAWMARNEWFGSDKKKAMTSFALGLHQELVDKYGQDFARTDEYFTQIDAQVRRVFPSEFGIEPETQARETPTKQKPATVVAPASRVTAAKKIRLTQTQVAIAKRLGVPLETYAKHVAAMEKQNG